MNEEEQTSIADMREDYRAGELHRSSLDSCPFDQFHSWFQDARDAGIREANAMTLSTVGLDGSPTARTVLMKDLTANGISFFTNYTSRKGREVEANPNVSLLFFWNRLERQVQIRGQAQKIPREESEVYFFSRPYDSRIGAWASRQSEEIADRDWLQARMKKYMERFPETDASDCVPLPDFWGGYRVAPVSFEFWQGQPGRTHDRFEYRLDGKSWVIRRLSP